MAEPTIHLEILTRALLTAGLRPPLYTSSEVMTCGGELVQVCFQGVRSIEASGQLAATAARALPQIQSSTRQRSETGRYTLTLGVIDKEELRAATDQRLFFPDSMPDPDIPADALYGVDQDSVVLECRVAQILEEAGYPRYEGFDIDGLSGHHCVRVERIPDEHTAREVHLLLLRNLAEVTQGLHLACYDDADWTVILVHANGSTD